MNGNAGNPKASSDIPSEVIEEIIKSCSDPKLSGYTIFQRFSYIQRTASQKIIDCCTCVGSKLIIS